MTTVENQPPQSSTADDIYDSDDYGNRDTPPLIPMKINLQPSPSPPPAVPLPQVSPEPSPEPPGRKGPNRPKNRPSQGDAVLVSFMDGGKNPEIARNAGNHPLASDDEEGDGSVKGVEVEVTAEKEDLDLTALAANALRAHEEGTSLPTLKPHAAKNGSPSADAPPSELHRMEGVQPTMPSITATYVDDPRSESSPDAVVKPEIKASPTGELPPIRQHSPKSALSNGNGTGPITLPSLSDQLGDLNHLADAAATGESTFSQSPPARPPPRFSALPGQGSPPKSPNDAFRRELPSPGRGTGHYYFSANSHRRPSQTEGPHYSSAGDYSSSNTETPSTDQSGSTPAMAIDRMSIDGITNPQIGGFQCSYPGCTAQPFQTQYLLNSHANVHSSNRPHYCSVKGCPRSEGGKGFKRKNEMIRHGLVHDSPGYVCPFCPDREHKYPRPDNLQRHVRVHHVDKDKDDPQLREVLSQRPEGPSRGRRRRGGT